MKKFLIIWMMVNLLIGMDSAPVKNSPVSGRKEVIATVQVKIIIPPKDKQKSGAAPDTISQNCKDRLLTEEKK
jgi:hypothetical protein